MDGFQGRDYLTKDESREQSDASFYAGAIAGVISTIIAIVGTASLYAWVNNWF